MRGTIAQVVGAVVDCQFTVETLPPIYSALHKIGDKTLTLEVQQHMEGRACRAVAIGSTDGLSRGTAVEDTVLYYGAGGSGNSWPHVRCAR